MTIIEDQGNWRTSVNRQSFIAPTVKPRTRKQCNVAWRLLLRRWERSTWDYPLL
ncbi:hypothetical protein PR202_gb03984 [Eleusine coracana subsp. coracana]|uniref:Uncharacterized protein n=1 Tax=Eleusine coracana subsp. coracana TaxID=191504 RepID=A0AAV5E3D6_ELECO|nr:hypothetical protein PR202_gb03984 [Eleusine coracana subsp. coracana]